MKKILTIFVVFLLGIMVCLAEEDLVPTAKSAILIDNATGEVLYEKNADEKRPPASMTKLASMLVIMDAIEKGNLSFTDQVTISEEAANMGGSQVFLEAGEVYSVSDLLKGVAIASGNDAVVALSEKVGGSVGGFVEMMNKKMKEIGATNTNFVNPHGLDTENHYSTARDMAIIARNLLKYEKILEYTSIYEEYLEKNDGSKTWLVNTNKLVRFYEGVDGLKTGFTNTAGYCLTATAKKDNFRLISVVMGEDTSENRSSDTVKLLNYGFNTFKVNIIKQKNEVLGKVRIEGGKNDFVNVVLVQDATELLKNTDKVTNYKFEIKIDKVKAPVSPGDVVGTAQIIDENENVIDEVEITVEEEVLKANIIDYFLKNLKVTSAGKVLLKQN
ncbi:MAG: D-alanyl-D-alanine carboxypeptidase [Bacilli bacterium]|nr:D-alanyl-D-alanine carboxypeptidase [Bacilli bacterium]